MTRLTKRGYIGQDYIVQDRVHKVYNLKRNIQLPEYRYFYCQNEFCSEIISKNCLPTCNYTNFRINHGKITIFYKNDVITAKCEKGHEMKNSILQCNEFSIRNGTIDVKDCVYGKKSAGKNVNRDFVSLKSSFHGLRNNLDGFSSYQDLVIHQNVK